MKSQIKKKEWSNCGITNTNIFPQKKLLMRGQNYGEVVLNLRTNGQIMPRFGRSFIIDDKCIFQ